EARLAPDPLHLAERRGRRRVVEGHLTCLELVLQRLRQGVHIYLEADGQRGLRAYAATHAAMLLAGDGMVELQRVAPERFIAERVESEGLAPFSHHAVGVVLDH